MADWYLWAWGACTGALMHADKDRGGDIKTFLGVLVSDVGLGFFWPVVLIVVVWPKGDATDA